MINVKICRDIKSTESKLIFNMTSRQLLFSGLAATTSVGAFLMLRPFCSLEIIFVVIAFLCAPFVAFGFVKIYGLPFEKFLHIFLVNNLFAPKHRVYKSENFFKFEENRVYTHEDIMKLERGEKLTQEEDEKPKKGKKKKKYKLSKSAVL